MNEENSITGKRVALYIRVSSFRQKKDGLSLDEQQYALEEYAKAHGAVIVGIYRDEGTSARKNMQRRYELQRLLQDVKDNKVDVILFTKLDRWFRNLADFVEVQKVLDAHNVQWKTTQEFYDSSSRFGKVMIQIALIFAEAEADATRDRVNVIHEGMKRDKKALGVTGYGYKRNPDTHTIEIDETQAPLIREMFAMACNGFSLSQITTALNAKYGVNWWRSTYNGKLKNERYMGTFYEVPNYAPAIVSAETFARAQEAMTPRRNETPNSKHIYLFSGLIICPTCKNVLIGNTNIQKVVTKKDRKQKTRCYKNYRCRLHNENRCSFQRLVNEKHLEHYLLDHLQQELQNYVDTVYQNDDSAIIEAKERNIKEKMERLSIAFVNGTLSDKTYKTLSDDYKRQLAELQTQYTITKPTETMQDIIAHGIPSIYDELSEQGKKQFWHAILKQIDVVKYEGLKAKNFIYRLTFL